MMTEETTATEEMMTEEMTVAEEIMTEEHDRLMKK